MRTNDPMWRYYRFIFIRDGIIIAFLLFMAVLSAVTGSPNYFLGGLDTFMFLVIAWAFFATRRQLQRTEVRRQRALANDLTFLAQPQPTPNSNALELPVKISLRLGMKGFLGLIGIAYIVLALIWVGLLLSPGRELLLAMGMHPLEVFPFVVFLFPMFLVIGFLVPFIIVKSLGEQEIVVDEQGVTTKFHRQVTRIPWSEVQSFAMWGNSKRFSAILFELVSEQGVARWVQLGLRNKLLTRLSILRPDMSFDEYYDKMNRLQQVIAALTGKPLYDLRDEKMVWW